MGKAGSHFWQKKYTSRDTVTDTWSFINSNNSLESFSHEVQKRHIALPVTTLINEVSMYFTRILTTDVEEHLQLATDRTRERSIRIWFENILLSVIRFCFEINQ